ncbi:golgin subfamily A member 6-like protein 22 [Macrobrachium nipponense]|uniref:golgin subfamily A member 6-like protein 22 n=1 Tax=Macrobrachium nipponense TaxID=159736 RepID=UPI0030C8825F
MISLWQEKAKSSSLSTQSSNQGVEEIIFALKDVYEKRIKEIQDNHRSEIQAMENERSWLKATLKEKDKFIQKVTENVVRLMTRTTTNEEESISSRKCQESNKEEEVEKERKELADALKEIAKLKEELEELRREVRAGQKNDKDAKAEKRWVSAVKRNIREQHEERKQKRRDDRLRKLRDLIEFVKQERKIMNQKKKADREWLEREAMSLALYDHQVRMEERKSKKEAQRAFKQELKERNAQLKAEGYRLKNEIRTKLEEEHKRKKAKAKLEKQKLNSALSDLKRRKKDLWRKRKPKRSKVEVQLRDYIGLFLQDPLLLALYYENKYDKPATTQVSPQERRKKKKRATKGTHSKNGGLGMEEDSKGKYELIKKRRK